MTQAISSRPPAAGDRARAPATAVTVVVAAVTGANLLHAAAHVGRGTPRPPPRRRRLSPSS